MSGFGYMKGAILGLLACALLACAPMLAAVQTASTVSSVVLSPSVKVVSGKVQIEGKRGLILASNAYQAAGALVAPLIRARKLTSAQVDTVERLNNRAAALLQGVDKTLSLADRAAGIFSVADDLNRLAGR